MNNQDSFENIIKSKMNELEILPPHQLGKQLTNNLGAKKSNSLYWQKAIILVIGFILLTFLYTQFFKSALPANQSKEQLQQANKTQLQQHQHQHEHGHEHHSPQKTTKKLIVQTPENIKNEPYIEALKLAKTTQRLIFIHAYNLDCNHCMKMKEITLVDKEVHSFLTEHFVKIDIDMQNPKNIEVIRFYEIKSTPSFLFLDGNGQLIVNSGGFHKPDKFIEILERVMEWEASGTYLDLPTRKIINSKKKPNPLPTMTLAAKVYPNPTHGPINIEVKGQKLPLHIRLLDLNGRIVFEKIESDFDGAMNQQFNLSAQKGQFILQIVQDKEMVSKKLVIQ